MIKIGKINKLPICEITEKGCFLQADDQQVFIPLSQMKEGAAVGDHVDAFLYYDDDRLTATGKRPRAQVGELAYLQIIGSGRYGYFLNNGIRKDIFLPFDQVKGMHKVDDSVFVYVYLDYEKRLCATTRYEKHFSETVADGFKVDDQVKVLPIVKTPLGIKALVENRFFAMFMNHDLPKDCNIKFGKKIYAFIKNIRDDQKVDLVPAEHNHQYHDTDAVTERAAESGSSYRANEELSGHIIKMLQDNGGFIPFNDHSDPKVIMKIFKVSKGIFKKTIDNLYKQNRITIEFNGIRLNR